MQELIKPYNNPCLCVDMQVIPDVWRGVPLGARPSLLCGRETELFILQVSSRYLSHIWPAGLADNMIYR